MTVVSEDTITACATCGKGFYQASTGRPRRYCGDKCKEASRRKRDRARDDWARQNAGASVVPVPPASGSEAAVGSTAAPSECRVCGRAPARIGPPGNPILCQGCAAA